MTRITLVFIFLSYALILSSKAHTQVLYPYCDGLKHCGYMNLQGQKTTNPIYTKTYFFDEEGHAIVHEKTKNGEYLEWVIDEKLNNILEGKYSSVKPASKEAYIVGQNGKYGIIKKSGQIVLPIEYDKISPFTVENLAVVWKSRKDKRKKRNINYYGLIDLSGNFVLPVEHSGKLTIKSHVIIINNDDKFSVYNLKGKPLISDSYDDYFLSEDSGHIYVMKNNLWGLYNTAGIQLLKPRFTEITRFSEGVAAVNSGKSWHFIDKSGQKIIPQNFEKAGLFRNGVAAVKYNNENIIINTNGNRIIPGSYKYITPLSKNRYVTTQESLKGIRIIDQTEKPLFTILGSVDISVIKIGDATFYKTKQNHKYQLIDTNGFNPSGLSYDSIMSARFVKKENTFSPDQGFFTVTHENKVGVIDKTGRLSIPLNYDIPRGGRASGNGMQPFIGNVIAMKKNGKWGLVNSHGREITKFIYDQVKHLQGNLYRVHMGPNRLKGNTGIINLNGDVIIPIIFDTVNIGDSQGNFLVSFFNHEHEYVIRSVTKTGRPIGFEYGEVVPSSE